MKQRPFSDTRPSMRTNVLLQRPKVGQVLQTTRNLPDEDFAFSPRKHDNHGVKEIFQDWEQRERDEAAKRERSARRRAPHRQDYVATNRRAVRVGCVTAKDFHDFKKRHEILVKPKENFDAEDDLYNRMVHREMVHGITTPVSTEMRDTITWQYGRDAVECGRERQERRHRSSGNGRRKKVADRDVKYTKAARGQTVKPPVEETYGDTFRIDGYRGVGRYAIDDHCPARRRRLDG